MSLSVKYGKQQYLPPEGVGIQGRVYEVFSTRSGMTQHSKMLTALSFKIQPISHKQNRTTPHANPELS